MHPAEFRRQLQSGCLVEFGVTHVRLRAECTSDDKARLPNLEERPQAYEAGNNDGSNHNGSGAGDDGCPQASSANIGVDMLK